MMWCLGLSVRAWAWVWVCIFRVWIKWIGKLNVQLQRLASYFILALRSQAIESELKRFLNPSLSLIPMLTIAHTWRTYQGRPRDSTSTLHPHYSPHTRFPWSEEAWGEKMELLVCVHYPWCIHGLHHCQKEEGHITNKDWHPLEWTKTKTEPSESIMPWIIIRKQE